MPDPLVDASSEVIGGPLGRHARTGAPYRTWWLPIRVLLAVAFLGSALAFASFQHCRAADWQSPDMYVHACYSDVAAIYTSRSLDQHRNPFTAFGDDAPLAYPVLTNVVIAATSWLVPSGTAEERRRTYFDVNALLTVLFLAAAVVLTARLVDPWRDAIFVALAPAGLLSLFIAWDGLAVLLTLIGLLLHRRGSPWLAGVMIGLAIATAFYPIVMVIAFYIHSIRARGFTDIDRVIVAALGTWGAVDIAFATFAFDGVVAFYELLARQGASYGSPWLALSILTGWVPTALNLFWLGSFGILVTAITTFMRRRDLQPTIGQAALLVAAAYFLTAKSYAPQHVLFLIPLAVLARLRWRDLVIWQVIEVIYHVGLWQYLAVLNDATRGLDAQAYGWITMLHIGGLLYLMWRTLQRINARHPGQRDVRDPHPESPGSHQPALP